MSFARSFSVPLPGFAKTVSHDCGEFVCMFAYHYQVNEVVTFFLTLSCS